MRDSNYSFRIRVVSRAFASAMICSGAQPLGRCSNFGYHSYQIYFKTIKIGLRAVYFITLFDVFNIITVSGIALQSICNGEMKPPNSNG